MTSKITILYVDDEPLNLQIFKMNMSKKYDILTAINGFDGLKCLRENTQIQVVISDMKMPEMNGLQFIVKAREDFPNIQYYILTGFEITDEISSALRQNIIHKYFQKPFNITDLENTISQAVN